MRRLFPPRYWPLVLLVLAGGGLVLGRGPHLVAAQSGREPARPAPPPVSDFSGWFSLLWVDPPPGAPPAPGPIPLLTDDQGRTVRLEVPEELAQKLGGLQSLDRHPVSVRGHWMRGRERVLRVTALQEGALPAAPDEISAKSDGEPVAKPYAVILCRFADTTTFTPHPADWYAGLMSDAFPGASHYWQETSLNGISVTGSVVFGWYNLLQGNAIGTDAAGARMLGNALHGVIISGGASGNTVGGTAAGAGNQIGFQGGDGIRVADAGSIGNTLRGNALFRNTGLGINLFGGSQNSYGVTANDPGDADTGPNNLQNFPEIEEVTVSSGETVTTGRLSSRAGATFALDFYASPQAHASGHGEGAVYLGTTSVTTDASGNATFVFRIGSALSDRFIAATATDTATGDTGEFGPARRGF